MYSAGIHFTCNNSNDILFYDYHGQSIIRGKFDHFRILYEEGVDVVDLFGCRFSTAILVIQCNESI